MKLHYEFEYFDDFVPANRTESFAKDIKIMKASYLGYDIMHVPETLAFYPNYGMIAFGSFLVLTFSIIAYFLYQNIEKTPFYQREPVAIGGWLIIIMIGLAVAPYNAIKEIIDNKYFDLNKWDFYSARQASSIYKVFLTTELLTSIYICCFATFCFILMLKKRDILPKLIIIYFASVTVLIIIIHILSSLLYGEGVRIAE